MSKPATAAESRRAKRLSLALPIVIHGKDAQQTAFRERTHTLIVNKHGARFLTSQQLAVGGEILVENPALRVVAKAKVVWVSAKRNANGFHEAGAQFVESQNVWGIEFPPDDWTLEGEEQGAPAAKEAPAPRPAPPPSPPAPAPPRALTSDEIATQFLQDLQETADAHARQFRERLQHVMQGIGQELEMDLRERAGAAKELELAAVEQQIQASRERLSALQAEMEQLEARLAESQGSMAAAWESVPLPLSSEQIHEKIEAEALPVLHLITESGIGAAREHFKTVVQADAGQALADWRSQFQTEKDSLLEETRQQIMTAMTAALEAMDQERDVGIEEMKRQTVALSSEQVRKQVEAQVEESAQGMAEKALQAWQAKLQELTDHAAASSSEQVQGRVAEALNLLGPKLQEMQERAVNDAVEAFRGRLTQFLGLLPTGGNK